MSAAGTPMDLNQWRKQWSHPPTPIPANATGLWYSEECVDQMLADFAKLAEDRERDHAEEIERLRSFQLNYEHATKIERADFQQKIEMLQERERVLREALEKVCPMVYATRGEQLRLGLITDEEYRDMVRLRHSGIGAVETVCAALATPAPEQPAKKESE